MTTVHTATLFVTVLAAASAAVAEPLTAVIDWSDWDRMLRAHVVDGQVDYDAIAADPGFATTVAAIATAELEGHDTETTLAFVMNAYNVLAVQGILDGSSPRTAFGKWRFFYRDKYTIAGERLSLHAFENQRIRALGEPRIHFAIVCASASCPPLRSEAYRPDRLDEQLDDATRGFLNDPTKNRIDVAAGVARLSKIFKWFEEDFEQAAGSVQRYIAPFIEDERARQTLARDGLKVRHLAYDWSLNGTFAGAR
jgi:hypothetical protein